MHLNIIFAKEKWANVAVRNGHHNIEEKNVELKETIISF